MEEEQEDEAAREDEIFLLQSLEDEAANSKVLFFFKPVLLVTFWFQVKLTILIKLSEAIVGLGQVVKTVEVEDGSLIHMETRDPRQEPDLVSMEVLLTVEVLGF